MDTILVVNAGSSSLKFQAFVLEGTGTLSRLIKGQIDGIGTRVQFWGFGDKQNTLAGDVELDASTFYLDFYKRFYVENAELVVHCLVRCRWSWSR